MDGSYSTTGVGSGTGAGAGAGAGAAFFSSTLEATGAIAPSQPGAAVAGVQKPERQHSPEAARQGVPSEATQLLTMPALAAADTVIAERTSASLLNFDMNDSLGVRTILALGLLNTYKICADSVPIF